MAYESSQVAEMLRHQMGGVQALANSIGNSESSTTAKHATAVDFWQKALALTGADALNPSDAAFAQAELDKHQNALNAGRPYTTNYRTNPV